MNGNSTTPPDQAEENLASAPPAEADETRGAPHEPDALAMLEAERADLKERLLRALADTENLRRRSERELADARTYAVTNFARDMLTVADNIRRAIESVPADSKGAEGVRPLLEGVELTERDLLKTLERYGVKLLEPHGQKFDPNLHQAMFEVPDAEVASGTVVQVVQSGYSIGGRVLRPALVGVSKGGPKPAAATGESAAAPGDPAGANTGAAK